MSDSLDPQRIESLPVLAVGDEQPLEVLEQGGEAALVSGPRWRLEDDGVVVEVGRWRNPDRFTFVCTRHQWAYPVTVSDRWLLDGVRCPICTAEREAVRGLESYRQLHQRLAR